MPYLEHFGVKGQKWGIRRYQNPDGTLTEEGKNRAYALRAHGDVEKIFSSFSKKDKKLLGSNENDKEYLSREATASWVEKRFLAKEKNVPVAWLDIIRSEKPGEANIAIGTHPNFRGRGHASKLAKRGSKWIDQHSSKFSKVNWEADISNKSSRQLAEKNGFKYESIINNQVIYSKKPRS